MRRNYRITRQGSDWQLLKTHDDEALVVGTRAEVLAFFAEKVEHRPDTGVTIIERPTGWYEIRTKQRADSASE